MNAIKLVPHPRIISSNGARLIVDGISVKTDKTVKESRGRATEKEIRGRARVKES